MKERTNIVWINNKIIEHYWIIHEGFDAADISIVQTAVGRQLIHGAEGVEQGQQYVQLDESQYEWMGLSAQRRLQAVNQLGPGAHLVLVLLGERQLQ